MRQFFHSLSWSYKLLNWVRDSTKLFLMYSSPCVSNNLQTFPQLEVNINSGEYHSEFGPDSPLYPKVRLRVREPLLDLSSLAIQFLFLFSKRKNIARVLGSFCDTLRGRRGVHNSF